jgi:hypothetical protein
VPYEEHFASQNRDDNDGDETSVEAPDGPPVDDNDGD